MNARSIDPRLIRPSPIAGTWYPGSEGALAEMVDDFLAQAALYPTDAELIALISPHAGYPYSGQTAAYAYRQLAGRNYDLVVLLGPSHSENFGSFAITSKHYYSTPLGQVELDLDFVDALAQRVPLTRVDHDREHSLEIQLPFLQRVLGSFKLVPIMLLLPFYVIGPEALEPCQQLAAALADLTRGRRVLFVASSDLSHLPDFREVDRFDGRTAELIEAFDIPKFVEYISQSQTCRACGDAAIVTTLLAAARLGADRAHVLYRTNSSEVTGIQTPGQYTVGYLAAAVYKGRLPHPPGPLC